MLERAFSTAPDGRRYALPGPEQGEAEAESLRRWATRAGRPVVVVQGAGFVGAAMAVAVAAARDAAGRSRYRVVGVDLPHPASFWKCARANEGVPPVRCDDPELAAAHREAVLGEGNLRFTWVDEAYALADVVVVDVNLDVRKEPGGAQVELDAFEAAIRAVGRRMRPDALVLVESTVPPGTCARVVEPALREELCSRGLDASPLVAHSYERVMPGPAYFASIARMWRVYSGSTEAAAARAAEVLSPVVDTQRYPLTRLPDPTHSEMAKLLENSYRTVNIALIHEWTRLAEAAGVDLFAAIEAIRVRKGTHDNMRYPGFGVGGYCLTKDALLADWAARTAFGMPEGLAVAAGAVRINDAMPAHSFAHLEALLGGVAGKRVALLGVSYLPGVADTRASPSAAFAGLVEAAGGTILACDPMVERWDERPGERVYRGALELPSFQAAVFAVAHEAFRRIEPAQLVARAGAPPAVLDAQRVLSDEVLLRCKALGCRIRAVGRGHLR
jgi:nucleotide sugar dehydrogenase